MQLAPTTASLPTGPRGLPDALAAQAYWVVASRLLAGAYPGAADPSEHARKLQALVDVGVTHVISLMEEDDTDR